MIADGGYGHTSCVYLNAADRAGQTRRVCQAAMKTCRIILVHTRASHGGIERCTSIITTWTPSLTLGCGSWGGNSVRKTLELSILLNIKTVAERRENMLWFRAPEKVYFKKGCLPVALDELAFGSGQEKGVYCYRLFPLYSNGYTDPVTDKLDEMGITHSVLSMMLRRTRPLGCARAGAEADDARLSRIASLR